VNHEVGSRCYVHNRIAGGEVLLLRSTDGVFLAEIADADGDVVRRHGKVPIMVYVMVELKMWSSYAEISPEKIEEL
jgi:hypothetical protein